MKLALFLLPKAEEDIDSHCSFLAKTSLEMALKFVTRLTDSAKCRSLVRNGNTTIRIYRKSEFGLLKVLKNTIFIIGLLEIMLKL
jgi:hypothetical protein